MMDPKVVWAEAIGTTFSEDGPSIESVVCDIRNAVIEAGFVSRGRLTSGLKEAYGPFAVDEAKLSETVEEALRLLLLSGDLDQFSTASGRGYVATPPRRVCWGGPCDAFLGAVQIGETGVVRRLRSDDKSQLAHMLEIPLSEELGRPGWRTALVEIGSSDQIDADPAALFSFAKDLAAGGDRFTLDLPQDVAVLSERGRFFGQASKSPSGRWARPDRDGCFPAVVRSGYTSSYLVMNLSGASATVWEPPSRDIWRWIVIGATVAAGDPVVSFDANLKRLDFLTPPPEQLERVAMLMGSRTAPWSWDVDDSANEHVNRLTSRSSVLAP